MMGAAACKMSPIHRCNRLAQPDSSSKMGSDLACGNNVMVMVMVMVMVVVMVMVMVMVMVIVLI